MKNFLRDHSKLLIMLYVSLLILLLVTPVVYCLWVPSPLDIALSYAGRTLAFNQMGRETRRIQALIDEGDFDLAEKRLLKYIRSVKDVTPRQIRFPFKEKAFLQLAEVYRATQRANRYYGQVKVLAALSPQNYYYRLLLGKAAKENGDWDPAIDCFWESFKLAPHHPETFPRLAESLSEKGRYEEITDAYRFYQRSLKRITPVVRVQLGHSRPRWTVRTMKFLNIPVYQGQYFDRFYVRHLKRGENRTIEIDLAPFMPWPVTGKPLMIELEFQNVFGPVRIVSVTVTEKNGEVITIPIRATGVLHREYSAMTLMELRTDYKPREATAMTVTYSCAATKLDETTKEIVEKALSLVTGRGEEG